MSASLLPPEILSALRTASVQARLSDPQVRELLFMGVSQHYVESLPRLQAPADQLHSDLVRMSQDGALTSGSAWIVPPGYYTPIRQDAVILNKGRGNQGAIALMEYLRGENARTIIRSFGYEL